MTVCISATCMPVYNSVCVVARDAIMRECWEYYPTLRPTFTELVEQLGAILTSLAPQVSQSPLPSLGGSHEVIVQPPLHRGYTSRQFNNVK